MSLEICDLKFAYAGETVLSDFNLTVPTGQLVSVLGPSGVGKTTLLKLIAGLLKADLGEIRLDSKRIDHKPVQKRDIAMVFQDLRLFPHMTVYENIAFPLKMQGVAKREWEGIILPLLAEVHLSEYRERSVTALSGGQRQRVAIARALAQRPKLLLLDEPFSSLDENLRLEMRELLLKIKTQHDLTGLMITHDKNEAMHVSDQIAILHNKHIEQIGTAEELLYQPESLTVARYFGSVNQLEGLALDGQFSGLFTLPIRGKQNLSGAVIGLVRPVELSLVPDGDFTITQILRQVEFTHYQIVRGDTQLEVVMSPKHTNEQPYAVGNRVGVLCLSRDICCLPKHPRYATDK